MVADATTRPGVAPDEGTGHPPAEPLSTEPGLATEPRLATPRRPVAPKLLSVYPPLVDSDHVSQPSPHRHGGGMAAIGWVLTLMLLAALATGFLLERERIQAAWPASQRLYAALGL